MFQKGHKFAKGGARPGAGKPADWLKARCQALIQKHDLIGFLVKVASGADIDQTINENRECLKVPAHVKDRLKATEMLLERGYGKVPQAVVGEDGGPVKLELVQYSNQKWVKVA